MTPTLRGRTQTRLALALTIGLPIVLLAAAVLDPLTVGGGLALLAALTLTGLVADAAYQVIQERRPQRDWPPLLALAGLLPEIVGSWLILELLGRSATVMTSLGVAGAVAIAGWAAQQGPLTVLVPASRYRGGRLIAERPEPAALPAEQGVEQPAEQPEKAHAGRTVTTSLRLTPHRLVALVMFGGVVGSLVLLAPIVGHLGHNHHHEAVAETDHGDGSPDPGAVATSWDTGSRVRPAYLEFADAKVASNVAKVRVNARGVLTSPRQERAAWYADGAAPGQRGPAVLIGSSDAVFANLTSARAGQELRVVRADGSKVNFAVDRVRTVDASRFPTDAVYGASPDPLLRLVGYDHASGRNVIVFAHAVSMVPGPVHE